MKKPLIPILAILTTLCASAAKPNFIIIFTDDQGYQDLGCFGSPNIKTPNIDRMAKEGRRFTSFMVASPVCTPSRALAGSPVCCSRIVFICFVFLTVCQVPFVASHPTSR